MPTVTILGSTGSIGASALRVLRSLGGEFTVSGLSCHSNIALLDEQIREFRPRAVAITSQNADLSGAIGDMKRRYPGTEFLEGGEGLIELCERDADVLVAAIVGAAGLKPVIAAIPHVKRIALANKETLVMAGTIVMSLIEGRGVELIPVDSEHSAIFSLLDGLRPGELDRIILTASGGSLRDRSAAELDAVTPEEALAHPTWDMGSKITIDSATLMNKGFEVIEAHHLFGLDYERIGVVIHPESVIHSMVETVDGVIYAHMSVTDMAIPIMNALVYPQKRPNPFGRLDLAAIGSINFRRYDRERFPALELCYYAGRTGGTMPAVLNAANEIAVHAFIGKKIRFTDIVRIVEKTLDRHDVIAHPSFEEIIEADIWSREIAAEMI